MASSGPRKQFGPAGERRRAELMEAAVRLAANRGFSRTRVSDIVGHVGVGQGVFYWYFESKDALFREILTDTTQRMRFYQGAFIAGEDDPVRRIAKGILATLDFIVHNAHVFALLDHEAAQARRARRRRRSPRVHELDTARHLGQAIEQGLVRRSEPLYLAQGISGVVDHLAREYFSMEQPDLDRIAQEAIDFCLGGIQGPQALKVAELRAEIELTPELIRLRDQVGAADGDGRPDPDASDGSPSGERGSSAEATGRP